MSKDSRRKQINVRLTDDEADKIDEFRSKKRPIPSPTEVFRMALNSFLDRELKGHREARGR